MATPLQDFCLKNSMDRGAWWATVHGVTKKSDTIEHEHENFKGLKCEDFKLNFIV